MNNADIIILGAGVAGLMAARVLNEQGISTILVDKGRSVGGRMATRRIGDGLADHGAQFFTARTKQFQAQVEDWMRAGVVRIWGYGWSDSSLKRTAPDGHPRYVAVNGMNALTQHMAATLPHIHVNCEIGTISYANDLWTLTALDARVYVGRALIMTAPVPQSLHLLRAVSLTEKDRAALERIQYAPCLTGMFVIEGDIDLPEPGAIQDNSKPIYWIGDNRAKGISQTLIVTAQADGLHSRQRYDLSDEDNLAWLQTTVEAHLTPGSRVVEGQLKKWRYAAPITTHPFDTMLAEELPLAFAGDAFGGRGRVEGAYLSGLAAGRALIEHLQA
ncbi:MAG: FAD-dependent oxidoreductase [Anaerolineae bacterium]|nr:FAD-dependent oxidoreductase [Anaerolineae bacterium]MDW8173887.1 FAD-dependent oxidoreductase [Anaerolineae bacterium]